MLRRITTAALVVVPAVTVWLASPAGAMARPKYLR